MAIILIVEDHSDTARATSKLLRYAGHRVEVACSCAAAREIVKYLVPDVLLCDILLPDGSGVALLRELRPRFPNLCAIAITGSVSNTDALRDDGLQYVFNKPIDLKVFESAISLEDGTLEDGDGQPRDLSP